MMKMFLSFLLMLFSFFMFFLNHPLSMGLLILIQTLLTCLLTGLLMKTYWFSYILFLTFLGGLLVLFIYVSSIASNETFKFSMKLNFIMLFFIFNLMVLSIYLSLNLKWMNLSINSEMSNLNDMFLFFNNENKINLSKLYNNHSFMMMMMMIIYLFITLVAIVKITNIFFGPLRSSLN
uniref:NADH-ubiquinone oxidoreductase chain 6 n=1 Tax=Ripeacma umbellata TaxID=2695194 RepID=A0A8A1RIV9_9NEOP|nr:NADH dehydrogenase subunit 6 [Ripeacma umbellata]QST15504.1 NADH dehydrogenase subunit 6 [Ripeacma umbellata]